MDVTFTEVRFCNYCGRPTTHTVEDNVDRDHEKRVCNVCTEITYGADQ